MAVPTRHSTAPTRRATAIPDSADRILIATDTFPPDVNGASYFTHRLAAGLAARGHDVHVVCPSPEGPPGIGYDAGVTLHRLRSVPVSAHPVMRAALPVGITGHVVRLIGGLAPHAVHAQSHFTVSRCAIRCGRMAGIPVVLTNHFMPENLFAHARIPDRLRGLAGALAWRDMIRVAWEADHVTTPTERAASLLAQKGFSGHVEAVSCGIDLERFRPHPGGRAAARRRFGLPERETALFVGRLDDEKRIGELIRALPLVHRHRDLQLVLVGTGQQGADLRRLAEELGVAGRVRFLGFVPDADLPSAYAAADLFAIASVAELQSIATLEAMSAGLPVVAADALALPHLVREGENGHLFPPGDIDALARCLGSVLDSERRRAAMGEASRRIAQAHDQQRSLRRFEEIYDEVRPRRARSTVVRPRRWSG